jgi:hypothetical protein
MKKDVVDSKPVVSIAPVSPSVINNEVDYITAFSFLQPKMSTFPKLWPSLLNELTIEEADDLQNSEIHVLMGLAGLLRGVPFKGFGVALHLDLSSFDKQLAIPSTQLESVYSILSQPKMSSCPKSWKALLEELSIVEAKDLLIVEPRVLHGLISLLKPTQGTAVLELLNK